MPAVVFQPSRLQLLVATVVALCATPVAFGAPYLWLLYLLPIGFAVWVVRTRTTVDADAVTIRSVLRRRRVPWSEISSLRLAGTGRVRAVLNDGAELPLPAVGVRDLPQLAAASGGRLPDPAGD
ncbi:PH domain-containing protein [Pseudonocardia broussonetiae]|uniref:PH domain-containing protein n=1 Tax=Pseudonocardia broussonetiae TaxID=2736640 RepID=A0A6M6JHQ9_9PSEU|nr:PH domain-containing protein [Pseudonocardia broussonetiae]QJY46976.1 PH domain-containing protein [Pseudonocardia broussonetiae]